MILLKKILNIKSVTPNDNGIQKIISKFLKQIGFEVFTFTKKKVTNSIFILYNKRSKKINLCFAGHTDVVSENNINKWKYNPFNFKAKKGKIYARGAIDMKSAVFAFCKAIKYSLKNNKNKNFLITLTSDEEGKAVHGTNCIIKVLKKKKIFLKNCILGEPTSEKKLFDTIKNGRRGSCNIKIGVKGKQGHTAYPKNSVNSVHKLCLMLKNIIKINIKHCSIQASILKNKNNTINIVPSSSICFLNIRYNTKINLYKIIYNIINLLKPTYSFKIINNNREFYKKSKKLIKQVICVLNKYNIKTKVSKNLGGTSDGRFFKQITENLIEIGCVNFYAHKYNENINVKDLFFLIIMYYKIILC